VGPPCALVSGPDVRARAACVLLALVAGCGGDDEAGTEPEPETRLEITVGGGAENERWTLTCDPAGGTHPDPDAACTALADEREALEPVPQDVACTQVFGGSQEAVVEGTLAGEPYRGRFNRRNGCEIDRWDRLRPLLVVRGGV
jgi:hypothetical protein